MKGLGLVDMIRSVALIEIRDDKRAQAWMDTYFNHAAVVALLTPVLMAKWGVPQRWVVERFVFGDLSVDEAVADLEEFTGEDDLATEVGQLATELSTTIVERCRQSPVARLT